MSRKNHNADLELSKQEYSTYLEAIADAGLMPVPIYLPKRHDDQAAKGWSTSSWSRQHWGNNLYRNANTGALSWSEGVAEGLAVAHSGARPGSQWGPAWVLICGSSHPVYGIFVIDIDDVNSPEIPGLWSKLAPLGITPSSHWVKTPRGAHYYYYVQRDPSGYVGSDIPCKGADGKGYADLKFYGLVVGPGSTFYKPSRKQVVKYTRQPVEGQDLDFADWVATIPLLNGIRCSDVKLVMQPGHAAQPKAKRTGWQPKVQDGSHPRVRRSDEVIAYNLDGGAAEIRELCAHLDSGGQLGRGGRIPCPSCPGAHRDNCHIYRGDDETWRLYCFTTGSTTYIIPPPPDPNLNVLGGPVTHYRKVDLIDGKYMPDHPITRAVTLVRAHKGAGKSRWASRRVQEIKQRRGPNWDPQIVAVTHRRALAGQLSADLQLRDYRTVRSPMDQDMVVCLDSLAAKCQTHQRGYVLVLDEICQQLSYLAEGGSDPDTWKAGESKPQGVRNWSKYMEMLTNADMIIGLDADLDAMSIRALQVLAPKLLTAETAEVVLVDDPQLLHNELWEVQHELKYAMREDVLAGKRIAIACSSVETAECLAEWLTCEAEAKGLFPRARVAIGPLSSIHSDPQEVVSDCDILTYTSTWGTGVDLAQKNYWHRVYGLFDADIQDVCDMSQMLGRVRYPIEATRRFYIVDGTSSESSDPEVLERQLKKLERARALPQNKESLSAVNKAAQQALRAYTLARTAAYGRWGKASELYAATYPTSPPYKCTRSELARVKKSEGQSWGKWKKEKLAANGSSTYSAIQGRRLAQWDRSMGEVSTAEPTAWLARHEPDCADAYRDSVNVARENIEKAVGLSLDDIETCAWERLLSETDVWGKNISRVAGMSRLALKIAVDIGYVPIQWYAHLLAKEAQADAQLLGTRPSKMAAADVVSQLLRQDGHYHGGGCAVPQSYIAQVFKTDAAKKAGIYRFSSAKLIQLCRDHGVCATLPASEKKKEDPSTRMWTLVPAIVPTSTTDFPPAPYDALTLYEFMQEPLFRVLLAGALRQATP